MSVKKHCWILKCVNIKLLTWRTHTHPEMKNGIGGAFYSTTHRYVNMKCKTLHSHARSHTCLFPAYWINDQPLKLKLASINTDEDRITASIAARKKWMYTLFFHSGGVKCFPESFITEVFLELMLFSVNVNSVVICAAFTHLLWKWQWPVIRAEVKTSRVYRISKWITQIIIPRRLVCSQ